VAEHISIEMKAERERERARGHNVFFLSKSYSIFGWKQMALTDVILPGVSRVASGVLSDRADVSSVTESIGG
jgi:hypothetical protein